MVNIIDKINSSYPISDTTIQTLKEHVTLCHFPKKYQLIKENMFCKSAYFIEKGMTRSFWLVNGEEITTSFAHEGSIVFSMDELYYNKVSEEFVETLEDVVAYQISLTDLLQLFQTNIELANWGFIKTNTDACTVHIKNVLRYQQKKDSKNSNDNSQKFINEYNWDMSHPIWELPPLHSAASEHRNNHYPVKFDIGQILGRISFIILELH